MSVCVRVGFAAPLTGDQAVVGVPMAQVATMAVDELNDRGSLSYPLELLTVDDEATEAGAKRAARAFVDDPLLVAVIGHKNTGPCLAAGAYYQRAEVAHLTPSATGVSLGETGRTCFFRLCCHDQAQGALAGEFAARQLAARRVLVVHDGTGYGCSLATAFQASLAACGEVKIHVRKLEAGHAQYPDVIDAMVRFEADLIYLALTEIEAAVVARQVREQGHGPPRLLGADGSRHSKFPELAGTAADGAYMTYAGFDADGTDRGRMFLQRYRQRYGDEPPVYGVEVYDAVTAVVRGLTAIAAKEPPLRSQLSPIIAALPAWEGLSGSVLFDGRGERVGIKPTMWVIQGNQAVHC